MCVIYGSLNFIKTIMILGIPKEIIENETRVAVIPATVKQFISAGFTVKIESGAGLASQISDQDFKVPFKMKILLIFSDQEVLVVID